MIPKTARRAAIYARISVTSEESVSLDRQVESARQLAAARGWQVVETFLDDGVSATNNKPEDRAGWRALLASPATFDAVIIWKIDRLARSTLDFLHADEALKARGAGIVGVEDPIDMTTPQGELFATILAAFARAEAAAIAARVKAARSYLIRTGRVVGGALPYGWRSIPNPDGDGRVLVHDLGRIEYVRGMAERVQRGDSLYSVMQWLDEVGAPLPTNSQKNRRREGWHYSTVERLLRNPVLAGMTAYNPGNQTRVRGTEVLRDKNGLPVVDESVAIMPVTEWRALVKALDERNSAQARPRAMKGTTSALLSGLVLCGHCDGRRMYRGTTQGRPGYSCPGCSQTVSNFEDVVVEEFLASKGEHLRWRVVEEVHEGGAALLPDIEQRLDELNDLIRQAPDREARQVLQEQQANLLDLRDEKRAEAPRVEYRWEGTDQSFGEDWAAAETVEDKRAVLDDALARVVVTRGGRGRRTREQLLARLAFAWKGDVGPLPEPDETWV